MKQFIVQSGSGKPAEMGSFATEEKVFSCLGLKGKKIGFAPFHHLDHKNPNDWTLFLQIAKKLGAEAELLEWHKEIDLVSLEWKLHRYDVLVLGSGVCEPYLEHFFKNRLDFMLRSWFLQGKSLMGYSAGSICVGARYIHSMFVEEIFMLYNSLLHTARNEEEITEFIDEVCKQAPRKISSELKAALEKRVPVVSSHALNSEIFEETSMSGFSFLPKISILPHLNESIHSMDRHLLYSAKRYPELCHLGLPNGVALIHEFESSTHISTVVVGKNPSGYKARHYFNHTWEEFEDGEELSVPLIPASSLKYKKRDQ